MVPPAAPQLYVILSLFQCPLWVCPDLDKYPTDSGPLRLGLAGQHQHSNASMALQLSHTWLQRRCGPGVTGTLKTRFICILAQFCVKYQGSRVWMFCLDLMFIPPTDKRSPLPDPENNCVSQAASFKPSSVMVKGLADAEWAGRTQTLRHGALTYFLDGAHTRRSMQACIQWFRETATQHERNASGAVVRVLLFNTTGERDSAAMLKLLVPFHFDFAVFCPNITEAAASCNAGQIEGP
ncbi:hypothetical protein XENOCAPTIV_020211 [Xenoophorus captivus]|uniref:Folylpolyglutamate synthase n=1 Tax=Xenoophorus captivus TaxID=1517983 RepID=A0ABV0S7Y8_9TELE